MYIHNTVALSALKATEARMHRGVQVNVNTLFHNFGKTSLESSKTPNTTPYQLQSLWNNIDFHKDPVVHPQYKVNEAAGLTLSSGIPIGEDDVVNKHVMQCLEVDEDNSAISIDAGLAPLLTVLAAAGDTELQRMLQENDGFSAVANMLGHARYFVKKEIYSTLQNPSRDTDVHPLMEGVIQGNFSTESPVIRDMIESPVSRDPYTGAVNPARLATLVRNYLNNHVLTSMYDACIEDSFYLVTPYDFIVSKNYVTEVKQMFEEAVNSLHVDISPEIGWEDMHRSFFF